MLETDMIARLEADAPLAALVAARIYPLEAPPGVAFPYLTYTSATDSDDTLDDSKSVHRITITFDCHAESYAEARAIEAALKTVLDGWRGDAPDTIMSMSFAGAHDGVGEYNEEQRRRRSYCRELIFIALTRA